MPTGPSTVLLASTESITLPTKLKDCSAVTWEGIEVISTELTTCTVRFTKLSFPSHLPAPGVVRLSERSSAA